MRTRLPSDLIALQTIIDRGNFFVDFKCVGFMAEFFVRLTYTRLAPSVVTLNSSVKMYLLQSTDVKFSLVWQNCSRLFLWTLVRKGFLTAILPISPPCLRKFLIVERHAVFEKPHLLQPTRAVSNGFYFDSITIFLLISLTKLWRTTGSWFV